MDELQIWTHSLSPALAEVRLRVPAVSGNEVRGQLTGPRCRFASTVEVAYPLRPVFDDPSGRSFRAVIPEPSLWEPECPFLYHGVVKGGTFTYGLRQLSRTGERVCVNGRPIDLRGTARAPQTEQEASAARSRGMNVVCAGVVEEAAWDLADSFGYFVLGRLNSEDEMERGARYFSRRACLLAWLVHDRLVERLAAQLRRGSGKPPWIALVISQEPSHHIPTEVSLLVQEGPELKVKGVP
jgi:hypothetical protein